MTSLQFGKYRGKSFLWLLQNDVGWAVMLMADHEVARGKTQRSQDPQWDNKEALYRYTGYYLFFNHCVFKPFYSRMKHTQPVYTV